MNRAEVTVGHCKDCRQWERDVLDWEQGICQKIDDPQYNPSLAFIVSPADAKLFTASDFGCVLFEARRHVCSVC